MRYLTAIGNRQIYFLFPILMFLCLAIGFRELLPKLMVQWDAGDNSYGYMIIPLVGYLLWEKRTVFQFQSFSWSYAGVVPILLSVCLIVIGELGAVLTFVFVGMWGCFIGIFLILYGKRIVHLGFPLFILAFIIPLPPFINRSLTFQLRIAASTISTKMLQMSGISALREGNIIDLGISQLQVVDACSGLRYVMPLLLMGILIGYFFNRSHIGQRLVLVLLVIPLSVAVNGFRIFITGVLTVNGLEAYAENFYHDFSGWLVFMIAGAILVGIALGINRLNGSRGRQWERADDGVFSRVNGSRSVGLTGVACGVFIVAGLILAHASRQFVPPKRVTFDSFPMKIGAWVGKRSYLSDEILKSLWADDYIQASYQGMDSGNTIMLFIPYYEYQETHHTVHVPQSCLFAGGWDLKSTTKRQVRVTGRGPIPTMNMVMQKGNRKLLSTYFFLQRGRVLTSPWENKLYLMLDALVKKRTDGALVRIEMLLPEGQSLDTAYGASDSFLKDVWPLLWRYVPD